jgi:crescentin
LAERITALTKALDERDTTLAQTNGKLEATTERMTRLESQVQTNRSAYEKHIDDLTEELHRVRMDKAVVDEALDTARTEQTRLQEAMATKIIAEPVARARPPKPERKTAARRH